MTPQICCNPTVVWEVIRLLLVFSTKVSLRNLVVEFQANGSNYVASFLTSLSSVALQIFVVGNHKLRYVSLWLCCGFGHVCMWHWLKIHDVLPRFLGFAIGPLDSLLFSLSLHSHFLMSGCTYQNIDESIQPALNTLLLFSSNLGLGTGGCFPCHTFSRNREGV